MSLKEKLLLFKGLRWKPFTDRCPDVLIAEGSEDLRPWLHQALKEQAEQPSPEAYLLYIPQSGGFMVAFYPSGPTWGQGGGAIIAARNAHYELADTKITDDFDDGE